MHSQLHDFRLAFCSISACLLREGSEQFFIFVGSLPVTAAPAPAEAVPFLAWISRGRA